MCCMMYDWLMTSFIFWSLNNAGRQRYVVRADYGSFKMTGILLTAMFTVFATAAGITDCWWST